MWVYQLHILDTQILELFIKIHQIISSPHHPITSPETYVYFISTKSFKENLKSGLHYSATTVMCVNKPRIQSDTFTKHLSVLNIKCPEKLKGRLSHFPCDVPCDDAPPHYLKLQWTWPCTQADVALHHITYCPCQWPPSIIMQSPVYKLSFFILPILLSINVSSPIKWVGHTYANLHLCHCDIARQV